MVSVGKNVLPNLLIIGAQKCGTTSMHNYLSQHPEIFMSDQKELNYFIDSHAWGNWRKGLPWYKDQFSGEKKYSVRGESSVSYSRWDLALEAAEKIHNTLNEVKFIYIIRDPIDRLISAYCHLLYDSGWPDVNKRLPLEKILLNGSEDVETGYLYKILVGTGLYGKILEVYSDLFGRENLFVMNLESLSRRPMEVFQEITEFVGVPFRKEYFESSFVYNRKENHRVQLFDPLSKVRKFDFVSRIFDYTPVSIKRMYRYVVTKKIDHNNLSSISTIQRRILSDMYTVDNMKINNLCGRKILS